MATADLHGDGPYIVRGTEPVGDEETLLARVRDWTPDEGTALIGFDFSIGLPRLYAKQAGITGFREALATFGGKEWQHYFERSDFPTPRQPFFPAPSQARKGGPLKQELIEALGLSEFEQLLRRCEKRTSSRGQAECTFFCLGAKQVGPATISGWRDVLQPALDDIRLWPFDGELATLLEAPGAVGAEIYPAEAYTHLGFRMGPGTKLRKSERTHRQSVCRSLLRSDEWPSILLDDEARIEIESGFDSDDQFDAMMGLLSMLLIVTGEREWRMPGDDPDVYTVEGWILGQNAE